jgi:RNA polymerase sigma-70 factor (ECF subfamily)
MLAALRMSLRESAPSAASAREVLDFDEVYQEHFEYVWCTARRLGAPLSSLDDVVQDAFVVIYRRLAEFDGGALRAWMFVIVRNVVRDVRRAHRRKPGNAASNDGELVALLEDSRKRSPEDLASANESLRLVELLLEALADDKREVLVLTEFDGLTAPEIARTLSLPLNTVYSRLRNARADFAAAWERAEKRVTEGGSR